MSAITASPLYWPAGVPRNDAPKRSQFGKYKKPIPVSRASNQVLHELRLMGGTEVIISTNLKLRLDGLPRSGQREPEDPGAAVWFERNKETTCIPIDQYDRLGCNLWAIAHTIEAMRGIERWGGSTTIGQAFKGFAALPAPEQISPRGWRQVFDYEGNDLAEVRRRYKAAMLIAHPDKGGSQAQATMYNAAFAAAKRELT